MKLRYIIPWLLMSITMLCSAQSYEEDFERYDYFGAWPEEMGFVLNFKDRPWIPFNERRDCPNITNMADFNMTKFAGRWYEAYRKKMPMKRH